jgi:hypothetical protein
MLEYQEAARARQHVGDSRVLCRSATTQCRWGMFLSNPLLIHEGEQRRSEEEMIPSYLSRFQQLQQRFVLHWRLQLHHVGE